MKQQKAISYMVNALSMVTVGTMLFKACKNIMERTLLAKTKLKEHNFKKMRPKLAWLPLEVVKKTFDCTTQLAMGSLLRMPFRQHHKSRTP